MNREIEAPAIEFSIIVPTFERPEALRDCLGSLARLHYPKELFEVIVVDDGGKTNLEEIVGAFAGKLFLQVCRQDNKGPAAARNLGTCRARGEYLIFTDDDCQPAEDWLNVLAKLGAENPSAAISGCRKNAGAGSLSDAASQLITDVVCEYFNTDNQHPGFITTSNLMVPAREFRAVNGFDESFRTAEDREFGDRWRVNGLLLMFAPNAVVYHHKRLSIARLWGRYYSQGRGARRFHQKRRSQGRTGFRPDYGFYGRLFTAPFRIYQPARAALVLGLVLVAQIANSVGYWQEGKLGTAWR